MGTAAASPKRGRTERRKIEATTKDEHNQDDAAEPDSRQISLLTYMAKRIICTDAPTALAADATPQTCQPLADQRDDVRVESAVPYVVESDGEARGDDAGKHAGAGVHISVDELERRWQELEKGGDVSTSHAAAEQALKKLWADTPEPMAETPPSQHELDLQVAATSGFDLRTSWIGQRWARECKADASLRESYGKCMTPADKKAFREAWASRKCEAMSRERRHVKEYSKVDTSLGTYMCFGKLCEEYGVHFDMGRAITAAWKYASKCLVLRGQWVVRDEMSEEMFFLHLKRSVCHIQSEKWMLYEQESAMVSTGSCSTSVAASSAATPCEAQHAQGALTATAKQVKKVAKDSKKSTDGDDDATPSKSMGKLVADAFKHRDRLQSATALADALLAKVESGGDWAWASGSAVVRSLQEAKLRLVQKTGSLGESMLVATPKELKLHAAEGLTHNLLIYVASAEEVQILEHACKKLQRMHAAAMQ